VEIIVSRLALLAVLVLLAAPAHAEPAEAPAPAPAPAERDRVREAIDAGNYFFVKAFTARDAQAIADLYSEDGRVIAPGAEPASGRAAIAAFWQNAMQNTVAARLETLAVEAAGDLAIEDGLAHLTAVDGSESTARYVVVWKRVGRRWHLHRDIWNAGPDAAPKAEAAPERAAPGAAHEGSRSEPSLPDSGAEPSAPDSGPEPGAGPAGDEPFPGSEEPPPREDAPAPDEEPV
jgi:uncharacterized protein (TIGR02246 family)